VEAVVRQFLFLLNAAAGSRSATLLMMEQFQKIHMIQVMEVTGWEPFAP
jgi:hypothetical protein